MKPPARQEPQDEPENPTRTMPDAIDTAAASVAAGHDGATHRTPTPVAAGSKGSPAMGSSSAADDPSAARFAAGTLLAERYRIVRLLGRGGMGAVYHADDLTLEVPVALKFLSASQEKETEKLELFLNEVRLARQIAHPNVCRVYDVGEVAGLHFLSMEYIDGEDLASLLKRFGRLPRERAIKMSLEIAQGLAAAHERGILHRDLKPANLMIDTEGRARITDFGLASFTESPTDSAVMAGTPVYMAPEQADGTASVKTDLYALGLVLYELFTGRKPFSRPQVFRRGSLREAPAPFEVEDLDPGVERVILRCLEPEPDDRPASAAEVASVLERHAAPPWTPTVGAVIPHRNHWKLDSRLGKGGFGEAWLAVHMKTREKRVFKFCHEAAKLNTFQREITLFRLLKEELGRRDDITSILDWSLDEPPYFIEAEYTAGGNLKEWVERQGGLGAIDLGTRIEIAAQVATALAAAHSVGVMHKDVKPTNVLIKESSAGEPSAQLCDFGIGALTERDRLDAAGITVLGMSEQTGRSSSYAGTRLYMAPELLEGRTVTLPADVYALGVLLYQMVAGDFTRSLSSGWRRDVEDELLRDDVEAAVEGLPERRLAAAQLAERLRLLPERRAERDAEEQLRIEAEQTRQALERSNSRRKWITAALLVLLLFAAALVVAFEEGEKTARDALIEQTIDGHQGMARIAAAAVDRNLSAVLRRVEREAQDEGLRALMLERTASPAWRRRVQALSDRLYEEYKDRYFYSWVIADVDAVAQARSPYDTNVIGNNYAYREWFTGYEESKNDADAEPRHTSGLTLAFQSTAEGHPLLMSVASPIFAQPPDGGDGSGASGEPARALGVIAATVHLETFNKWLEVTEHRQEGEACPERFILLLNRGQLLRHPCPDAKAQPPVKSATFAGDESVRDLLIHGTSREFRDPVRPGLYRTPDLAVAWPLPAHPDWTVIVVQDRQAALRPLTRLTGRLRMLGRVAMGAGAVILLLLIGLVWRGTRFGGDRAAQGSPGV